MTKGMMSGVVYPTCSLNLHFTALILYLYGFSEEEINADGNEQRGLLFPDEPTGFSPLNCLVKGQAEVFVISPKSPTANSPPLTASEQIPNQPW